MQLSLRTNANPPAPEVELALSNASESETKFLNPEGHTWVGPGHRPAKHDTAAYPLPSSLPGARAECAPAAPLPSGGTQWTWSSIIQTTSEPTTADSNDAD